MKKFLLSLCAIAAATVIVFAATEKITIRNGNVEIKSFEVADISNITYSGQDGLYNTMNVKLNNGTTESFNLDDFTHFFYDLDARNTLVEEFDDHSTVLIINHYYNNSSDYADHYHMAKPDERVDYYWTVDLGYDVEVSIIGANSGTDYRKIPGFEYIADDWEDMSFSTYPNQIYSFLMPNEPIIIKSVATEHIYYENKAFIGEYNYGFWIDETIENHMFATSNSMFTANIKANGVFEVTSSDSNNYNFTGTFSYNEESNSIAYETEGCKKYALSAKFLSDDLLIGTVKNLAVDMPENTHYYFASKKPISFVRATGSDRDGQYVIELNDNGRKSYYFFNSRRGLLYDAHVESMTGTTLGQPTVAILTYDVEPYALKYTLNSTGSKPVILYAGSERGTYTASGNPTLTLDGFGEAKYGNNNGTYTINGAQVVFTPTSGNQVKFIINTTTKTYQVVADTSWNGPLHFSTRNSGGNVPGTQPAGANAYVELWLDHDYSGNVVDGKCKLTMRINNDVLADSTCDYTYNPNDNTIIVSYYYTYYTDAGWVEDGSLKFKVNANKRTLTLDYGTLSTWGYDRYTWFTGPIVLTADAQ